MFLHSPRYHSRKPRPKCTILSQFGGSNAECRICYHGLHRCLVIREQHSVFSSLPDIYSGTLFTFILYNSYCIEYTLTVHFFDSIHVLFMSKDKKSLTLKKVLLPLFIILK